jgi:cell division protein FtsW (lipid II flippase)
MSNTGRTDWFMFTIAAGLAVFGSVMVYSASAMMALKETQDQTDLTYFYKQFGFTLGGIIVMLVVSRIDYRVLDNRYVVYGLLALVFLR